MAKQYYSILTAQGELDVAQAVADVDTVKVKKIAVGDGNGAAVVPLRTQTALMHEVYRNTVTAVYSDRNNNQNVVVELNIPPEIGGFYIREIGVYNEQDQLIAVGNYPETFKPMLSSGSGQSLLIRLILKVQSAENVELTIDSSTVYATRLELEPQTITAESRNKFDQTGHSHEINKARVGVAGIVELSDDDDSADNNDDDKKAPTLRVIKKLKRLISGIISNLANYIPNSKKSDEINSTSSDNVATSWAVKKVYDLIVGIKAHNQDEFKNNIIAIIGEKTLSALGVRYDFNNPNAWWICFGKLFGNLIIQGGFFNAGGNEIRIISYPIRFSSAVPVRMLTPHMADGNQNPNSVVITRYETTWINQAQELHVKVYLNNQISGFGCFWVAFGV
ncbi:phage tail protein [Gallibacterium melopsittaci]|uniref:Phage tail protein n=1 Tax=Gallibacterium melopsittaci TaxID=516063 RepID=A0ABV6HT45_9PAST